jgi:release factor glutamine methyltransferase
MTEWHPLRSLDGNDDCEESEQLARQLWQDLDKSAENVGRAIANTSPAKMPTLEHSSMADYEYVYEPSDDTYLLIDAIKYDLFSGYPSDTSSSCGDNEKDNEEEYISRAALDFFYHRAKIQWEGVGDDGDEGGKIVQDLVEKVGSDRSTIVLSKLLSRLEQLRRLERIDNVMEIGTGSGVPITYLSKRLLLEKPNLSHIRGNDEDEDDEGFSVIATDLNPLALAFARKTAEENGVVVSESHIKNEEKEDSSITNNNSNAATTCIQSIEFVECDLATPLLDDCEGAIDVLVFNPPYVPTEDSEITGNGIEISWAGGTDGRIVVDRALPQISRLLRKPDGVCYMITVDDNRPAQMATILKEEHGLDMVPLVRRRARNEYLSVQKISWLDPTPTNTIFE